MSSSLKVTQLASSGAGTEPARPSPERGLRCPRRRERVNLSELPAWYRALSKKNRDRCRGSATCQVTGGSSAGPS